MDAAIRAPFRKNLLNWFSQHARVLPWRENPSLYKTVVSEFMLQQTQVKTVLPFFNRWMDRFPNFKALAESGVGDAIKLWEGLGYYSRAKNLRLFAQSFLKKPAENFLDLLKFKGVGPYTAAAIASIAWDEKIAVVDGNVIRVLARIFNIQTLFPNKDSAVKVITPIANDLIDSQHPGRFNEAVMELGALICAKNNPQCATCPLKHLCGAFKQNAIDKCPQFVQLERKMGCKKRLWVMKDGQLLLEPSQVGGENVLWELPELTAERENCLLIKERVFTGKRSIGVTCFTEEIYSAEVPHLSKMFKPGRYFSLKELNEISLSGPHKRWIGKLLGEQPN